MKLTSREESLYKTVTYRIASIALTYLVALLFTDSHTIASEITILAQLIKTVFYYLHERIWGTLRGEK